VPRNLEQIDEADVSDLAEVLLCARARHTTQAVIRSIPCGSDDGQLGSGIDPIHLSDLVEFIVFTLSNALMTALIQGTRPELGHGEQRLGHTY
jgi:hypothetical protein